MKYLLDTDTCIYAAKRKPAGVRERLATLVRGDVGISVVTYLELIHCAWKSSRIEENLEVVERLREIVEVAPLGPEVGPGYGRLRSELERRGALIGAHDLLIAAHALSLGTTLITTNVREFGRVQGLRVENWVE